MSMFGGMGGMVAPGGGGGLGGQLQGLMGPMMNPMGTIQNQDSGWLQQAIAMQALSGKPMFEANFGGNSFSVGGGMGQGAMLASLLGGQRQGPRPNQGQTETTMTADGNEMLSTNPSMPIIRRSTPRRMMPMPMTPGYQGYQNAGMMPMY